MSHASKKPAIVFTRFPYESQWGGEESHTLQVARHMASLSYEVVFMGSCSILLDRMKQEGFHTRKVWGGKMIVTFCKLLSSFLLFPFIIWNLRRKFKSLQNEFEVKALYCLSLNEKLFLSSYVASQGIPVIWVEHQEMRGWLKKSPWKVLYRANAKSVQIVPISENNKEALLDSIKVSPDNITEIINGVDVESIQSVSVPKEKGLIVYANRFIPKKGVFDFLESLNYIPDKGSKRIMVLGEGELEEEVKEKIQELEKIYSISHSHFLKKEKWLALLRKAEIFVCSSQDSNETFSLSSAEAMAAGCKLVITKPCGIVSFLDDRKDAVFADAQKPVNLAHKIITASEMEVLGENAMKTAREKFDITRMLKLYESLILRDL